MTEKKLFLGIDPGVTGAYALIDSDNEIIERSAFAGFKDFYKMLMRNKKNISFVAIEEVRIWRGTGSKSSTTFMKNAGGLEAMLEALNIRHKYVRPEAWMKKSFNLKGKPVTKGMEKKKADQLKRKWKEEIKRRSIAAANRFFGLNLNKKQDGEGDALNIARYAIRIFQGKD